MKKILFFLLCVAVVFTGCKENDILNDNKLSLDSSALSSEIYVGQIFYHDQPPGEAMDVFMADIYVTLDHGTSGNTSKLDFFRTSEHRIRTGINKIHSVEIDGRSIASVSINAVRELNLLNYQFHIKNIVNLTHSPYEDSSVNVNTSNWITFISDRTGVYEIFYMDTADRVLHQLTPIDGTYRGGNVDPNWKTDTIIIWSHRGIIVEADINDQIVSGSIVPEFSGSMYDPKYSPDGTKLLFNAHVRGKKNGYLKNLTTQTVTQVLPGAYAKYTDDNPNWLFSSTRITGHIFYPGSRGRIYIKDGEQAFTILTPSHKDFRYVTPVDVMGSVYLIFSDWSNGTQNITLWIANETGSILRPLNTGGDEAVWILLGLPVPSTSDDLLRAAKLYNQRFTE